MGKKKFTKPELKIVTLGEENILQSSGHGDQAVESKITIKSYTNSYDSWY